MSDMAAPDLTIVFRQMRQLMNDVGGLKDNVNVRRAVLLRTYSAMSALLRVVEAGRTHALDTDKAGTSTQ